MKKIMIFVLLLLLVGCTSLEDNIVKIPDMDIDVCDDSCETDQSTILDLFDGYYEKIDSLNASIDNYFTGAVVALDSNQLYDREDIPREDLVGSNYDLPIFRVFHSLGVIGDFERFVTFCEYGAECEQWFIAPGWTPTVYDYGFDENSGFINYTLGTVAGPVMAISFEFIFDGEDTKYEYLQYSIEHENYVYQVFEEGVYKKFHLISDTHKAFTYIDIETHEYLYYYIDGDETRIDYFNAKDEILYRKETNGAYSVRSYDGMEMVLNLTRNEEDYTLQYNLFYVDGWDTLGYKEDQVTHYSKVYLGDEEVFTDYLVYSSNMGLRYFYVYGNIVLTPTELDDYECLEGYTGDMSIDDLQELLDEFMALENPMDIAEVDVVAINTVLQELKEIFDYDYVYT